ncbi:MAG: response regulator [Synergistaceae bacterium]|nr:response regulator [Synergistaceae bacterium]
MKDKILVVDDIDLNRIILGEILHEDYDVIEASDGVEAVDILYNSIDLPQAVLLDIMMPEMDGFQVLELIKSNPNTAMIPVLFITAADATENEFKGLSEGAVDYISKPFNAAVVKARVDNHIQLKRYQNNLEDMVEQKAAELMTTHEKILETLATIIEYRSIESGEHIKRTSELLKTMVNYMLTMPKYNKTLMELNYNAIVKASPLHDIGKVGIPDSILLKPGKLTEEEFEVMKTHSEIGARIIDSINMEGNELYLRHCREICKFHHERWDGKGYPDKLFEEEIPLSARMVSIVDVYDALVSPRCYKKSMSHEKALEIIKEGRGSQFDPYLIDIFLEVERQFERLHMELRDPE